jgi:phenol hydroxylase P4 protein
MAVKAITDDYHGDVMDSADKFGGNQLTYFHWDRHLMFCSPWAVPLPAAMPFQAFVDEVVKPNVAPHPEADQIQWDKVDWTLDGKSITPDPAKSLGELGAVHKSVFRFATPELKGIQGSGS